MRSFALGIALLLGVTACGGQEARVFGPPEGVARMPDLVPDPPIQLRTKPDEDGRVHMLFTSTLVNVGTGDFILEATREFDRWTVTQDILYTISGAERSTTNAEMVWGGDGHEHWHINRVAVYWLEAVDADGNPEPGFERRFDTKVGFCFFDSHHSLEYGPDEGVYRSDACGEIDDRAISMGMSPAWSDVYPFFLPGQEVDIDGLPDGDYRLWAQADPDGWFTESNVDNNLTWVDIDLGTLPNGRRTALVVAVGPSPRDSAPEE